MKYQNFAVIFVIIVLPLSMVLSYYIQNQTDTLVLQTTYQTKLNDSTYDAIAAYQINSLNTQRVAGESIKSYVLASVNTFFTTLATNFGMSSASKHNLQNYVPAILFTTYDGYYIYSPTKMAQVAVNKENGTAVMTKEKEVVYAKSGSEYKIEGTTANTIANEEANKVPSGYTTDDPILTDKDDISETGVKVDYNYMVKPFIYYSEEYKKDGNYDIVASYTLDNYVTLYGSFDSDIKINGDNNNCSTTVDKKNFTKSGYLIDPDKINLEGTLLIKYLARFDGTLATDQSAATVENSNYQNAYNYNTITREDYKNFKNNVRYKAVNINNIEAYNYINYYNYGIKGTNYYTYEGRNYYTNMVAKNGEEPQALQTGDDMIADTLDIQEEIKKDAAYKYGILLNPGNYKEIKVTYNGIEIEDQEAKRYYIKAYFFSKWVQENLKNIQAETANQESLNFADMSAETKLAYVDFANDETQIFNIGSNNNPESEDSDFWQHKRNVIRNSIQYNLNASISTFNATYGKSAVVSYRMPVLTDNDWESILNNVCMVTFLQGLPCGNSKFNSYSVVKSNNNNTSVNIDSMYFVDSQKVNDGESTYHMYDCPELGKDGSKTYYADSSAEYKYDAKRILTRVKDASVSSYNNDNIVCLYDDSTNTYYEKKIEGGELQIGEEITDVTKYQLDGIDYNLTELSNGSEEVYLYDHKNLGCYTCIISKQYTPVVKFYKGDLRRTFTTNDGELIIEMQERAGQTSYINYATGEKYTGNVDENNMITGDELKQRQKAVYTYLAKIRNSLYKANDYINR